MEEDVYISFHNNSGIGVNVGEVRILDKTWNLKKAFDRNQTYR